MQEWLSHLHPVLLALIRVILWVVPVLLLLIPVIWGERRVLALMQDRWGPNRVGPFGLLQPIADITKLAFKEEIVPGSVDRFIYSVAPALALFPAFALGATVPFGPSIGIYTLLTPIADVNIGVLYMLAVSSLGVYGLVLAGYSGNNKYSLLGGLRASAQLISYELAMGMSLACIVMATGSLRVPDMVKAQEQPLWGLQGASWIQNWNVFTPFGFVAMIIFLICMVAETNRAPFDLPEAENELVAGYHTEYSSMKFVAFFMGEYAAMVVFGTILAAVFFGGYNFLPINWSVLAQDVPSLSGLCNFMTWISVNLAPLWLLGKAMAVIFGYIWIRGSLPRLRYDQLMNLGWKVLLPAATANLVVVALYIVVSDTYNPATGMGAAFAAVAVGFVIYLNIVAGGRRSGTNLKSRTVAMVEPEAPRRTIQLVDPAATSTGGSV